MLKLQVAGASDIISENWFSYRAGMTAEDIAQTIHAHPTLAQREITMEAAEVLLECQFNVNI